MATIFISAKCRDLFHLEVRDDNGKPIAEKSGYVPDFFPDDHYGDYIHLHIDPATGQILNWLEVSVEQILKDMEDM